MRNVADPLKQLRNRLLWPRDLAPKRPPTCQPGYVTGPPDFVGVGVQKAGTSWWYALIATHPGVEYVPGKRKELHYFDNAWQQAGPDLAQRYGDFFPRQPGKLIGEWTPRYLTDFWVPHLLAKAAPRARILVMLRDPVERFESAVAHELSAGGRIRPMLAAEAASRGFYHQHMTRLLHHFPREQVLVLQYERCRDEAAREVARTYEFLGLDPSFAPPRLSERVNAPKGRVRRPLSAEDRAELTASYAEDVERLAAEFPDIDLRLWPHFRDRITV